MARTTEDAVSDFIRDIDVRPLGEDRFVAEPDPYDDDARIFGGRILAQAVVAAGRTVQGFTVHSLHSYFLRGGNPKEPITLEVERTREGRTFAGRRVTAGQAGSTFFEASLSFVRPEEGIVHQIAAPEVAWPSESDALALRDEVARRWGGPPAFDMIEDKAAPGLIAAAPAQNVFWRPASLLPEDPIIHAAAMAWMSDNNLFATVFEHHALPPGVTLDHAMWWHRPPRFDGWLHRVCDSTVADSGRALMLASVFDRSGKLVASIAQEGLFRRSW